MQEQEPVKNTMKDSELYALMLDLNRVSVTMALAAATGGHDPTDGQVRAMATALSGSLCALLSAQRKLTVRPSAYRELIDYLVSEAEGFMDREMVSQQQAN